MIELLITIGKIRDISCDELHTKPRTTGEEDQMINRHSESVLTGLLIEMIVTHHVRADDLIEEDDIRSEVVMKRKQIKQDGKDGKDAICVVFGIGREKNILGEEVKSSFNSPLFFSLFG